MEHSVMTPNEYSDMQKSPAMKNPQGSVRVQKLLEDIRNSMKLPKKSWDEVGSVLNEETAGKPLIIRKALAIKHKLTVVPVDLWEGQLIPGSIAFFKDSLIISGRLPSYATKEELSEASKFGLSPWSIVGHIVPSYPRLLEKGVSGICKEAQKKLETCKDRNKIDFYNALIIAIKSLAEFSNRYCLFCKKQAEISEDPIRQKELLAMASDLEHSPENPPQTFRQAVISIWITHLAFQLTGNSLAVGRIDQHLSAYLEEDLKQNRIAIEEAQELIDCLFIKFNERAIDNRVVQQSTDQQKIQQNFDKQWANRSPFDHSTQKYNVRDSIDATNHWLQNVIVGGVLPRDGEDATNLVTLMCLEAFRRNGLTNPCLTVRLHSKTPQYLIDFVGEVLLTGGGLPALFNDDAIIPSLVKNGFPVEDARDYTNDGCWEVILAGRNDFYFDRFNMLRCLEWTLNRGRSRIDGKVEAPDVGDPKKISTYEELLEKFYFILNYDLKGIMDKIHENFGRRAMIAPTPLLSALLEGPMEKGTDMTAGGALYITYGLIAEGVSHVIDSLAAVKKVVFEDKKATMEELIDALNNDYVGYEGLRSHLFAAPKYGNNDPYADNIGEKVLGYFTETVNSMKPQYPKINFLAGAGTFSWYIAIGEGVGATPDGRLAKKAVSSNLSPSMGADSKGVTAAVISHSKMNMENLPVGSPLDLRVNSRLVAGPKGAQRLTGVIRSFVELGGNMMTLTVADTQTLRKAQLEPENYPTLRVRMGGWSAYFTMLSKEQQEHHINKQENL